MQSLQRTVLASVITTIVVSTTFLVATREPAVTVPSGTGSGVQLFFPAGDQEAAVVAAVKRAEPAVVSVIISKDLPVLERYTERVPFGNGFNIQLPRVRQNGTERREVGGGTAFFVSEDGILMTNKHVVSDEKAAYTVLLNDGRRLDATVITRDPVGDVALLKVDGGGFPALTLAPSDEILLGQTVIAIGNALAEFRNTVSIGVVSGLQRSIIAGGLSGGATERLDSIIQTDAAINEGNSGGPLLNSRGEVIGMNTAVATGAQNIGFALPVPDLRRVLKSYAEYGRIVRPYLGVRYMPVTADVRKTYGLTADKGAFIQDAPGEPGVIPGSPAEKAGLRPRDVIVSIDGVELTAERSIGEEVSAHLPGDVLTLTVLRGDDTLTLKATLEEWKETETEEE